MCTACREKPSNLTASVRQRLLGIIRETGDDANLIWTHYAIERFLYRLSVSEYVGDFILKGAMLFMVWTGQSYGPTVDMDLLEHEVPEFQNVISHLRDFLMPALKAASGLALTPQDWNIDGFWLYEDANIEDS